MKKIITLNRNSDFRRLYGRGKSSTNPALVTYALKNRAGICRFGITTSKKIGNAVERSRSRRVIRAAFRELYPRISGGWDIVFVARGKTKYMKSQKLLSIMEAELKSVGVLGDDKE